MRLIDRPASIIITGIIRLTYVFVPHSQFGKVLPMVDVYTSGQALTLDSVNFTQGETWSNIHLGTAILCACLPTYRPAIRRLITITSPLGTRLLAMLGISSHSVSSKSEEQHPIGPDPTKREQYKNLDDSSMQGHQVQEAKITQVSDGEGCESNGVGENSDINVHRSVDVV